MFKGERITDDSFIGETHFKHIIFAGILDVILSLYIRENVIKEYM